VDFLLAQLLLRSYGSNRQKLLQQTSDMLEKFLTSLDSYDLLSKQSKDLLDRYQEDRKAFQLAPTTDAAERRRIKVARFQEEKSLKAKLEVFDCLPRRVRVLTIEKMLRTKSGQSSIDEETIRRLYFTELELFGSQSFQSLDLIVQEKQILSLTRSDPQSTLPQISDSRQDDQGSSNGYSERLDGPVSQIGRGGPLLSKEGKPLQPFTITDKRTQLRQGVFRPGHSLPTMTIEDYLEEEKRRGGIVDGGGESHIPAAEPDEDNMDLADQETMKARAWDEYTEANPKGSGNTLNRG
jgi:immunoglobulin-binding protein 1